MKSRAAVAFEPKKPLEIVEVDVEGPKAGEVLLEIMATGICHTDASTLDGYDSEGIFPSILRSEEHTSELQSLMRISYAVVCLKKNNTQQITTPTTTYQ